MTTQTATIITTSPRSDYKAQHPHATEIVYIVVGDLADPTDQNWMSTTGDVTADVHTMTAELGYTMTGPMVPAPVVAPAWVSSVNVLTASWTCQVVAS